MGLSARNSSRAPGTALMSLLRRPGCRETMSVGRWRFRLAQSRCCSAISRARRGCSSALVRATRRCWMSTAGSSEGRSRLMAVTSFVRRATRSSSCSRVRAMACGRRSPRSRSLAACAWPSGVTLRVRMGLHTGEPRVMGHDYVGMDVHCAARICSAAHGGQVVVSDTTERILAGEAIGGVGLHDLGEHRLKDLGRPMRLHQIVAEGLTTGFPPLRTLEPEPTILPGQWAAPTALFGREDDVEAVAGLVSEGGDRLVTLSVRAVSARRGWRSRWPGVWRGTSPTVSGSSRWRRSRTSAISHPRSPGRWPRRSGRASRPRPRC